MKMIRFPLVRAVIVTLGTVVSVFGQSLDTGFNAGELMFAAAARSFHVAATVSPQLATAVKMPSPKTYGSRIATPSTARLGGRHYLSPATVILRSAALSFAVLPKRTCIRDVPQ